MLGFINIFKPSGVTSNFVVQKIKKKFKIKVGHLGTSDPMACGVLPIAVVKATRLFDYSLAKTKRYIAEFEFGYTTDTLDSLGEVIDNCKIIPTKNDISQNLPKLIGIYDQMPPKYSAKNINGQRAYDLARAGVEFELNPKKVNVLEFKLLEQLSETKFKFEIICSSGTYIRALGRDLAQLLKTCACMTYLQRTETGFFNIENSHKLDEILELDDLSSLLISPLEVFKNFDRINIDQATYFNLKNGINVTHNDINNNSFVLFNDQLMGITKPRKGQLKIDTYLEE